MITRQTLRPLANLASKQWVCASCSSIITSPRPSTTPSQRRTKYTVARLNHHDTFFREGIKGAFSREAYMLGYLECQDTLVRKLNELTAGKSIENLDAKQLAIRTGRNPEHAHLFNHASLAHNNHFFFQQFSPAPKGIDSVPELEASLIQHFGSIETLRREMTDTANSIFGQGFVWLVWAREPDAPGTRRKGAWRILNTYNAGTPYPEAGFMQQGLDMNTNNAQSYDTYRNGSAFGGWSAATGREQAKLPPGGTTVMPVMCISVWQHSYLRDWGQAGKSKYIDAVWEAIDWQLVQNRTPREATGKMY